MTGADPSRYVSFGDELPLSNLGQLELLRAMMERGLPFRTRVLGTSMKPAVRDEDIVTIVPLGDCDPEVGEVVAFVPSDADRLVLHRIVSRESAGWLLRGDNCSKGDGVIGREGILGRVVRIEREGRDVRFGLRQGGPAMAWLSRTGLLRVLRSSSLMPLRVASDCVRSAQGADVYRAIGRKLALDVEIVEADLDDLHVLRRDFHVSTTRSGAWSGGATLHQTITWVARRRNRPVGFVQLVRKDDAGSPWKGDWLCSLSVRVRYRGLGIGEALTCHVIERCRVLGSHALLLAVYEENRAATALYRKLGFKQVVIDVLEAPFDAEKRLCGRRRVVMRKELA